MALHFVKNSVFARMPKALPRRGVDSLRIEVHPYVMHAGALLNSKIF